MESFGFTHDKLDVKLMILFILRRLPGELDNDGLWALVHRNERVGYFEYAEYLAELCATGHVTQTHTGYRISEKGIQDASLTESSLPFTLREGLENTLRLMADEMRRRDMISAGYKETKSGCLAELTLRDTLGEMLHMRLLVPDAETARQIGQNFSARPEEFYSRIIEMLS